MKSIFGEKMADLNFKKEKQFLMVTLISFSGSYMVEVIRNTLNFLILDENDNGFEAVNTLLCKSNFTMSMYNIITWTITELIPYIIIFSLNFGNFLQMDQ